MNLQENKLVAPEKGLNILKILAISG